MYLRRLIDPFCNRPAHLRYSLIPLYLMFLNINLFTIVDKSGKADTPITDSPMYKVVGNTLIHVSHLGNSNNLYGRPMRDVTPLL